jgi:hypothetical protein
LERDHLILEIGDDGAIAAEEELVIRAYALGCKKIPGRVGWEAKILNPQFQLIACPTIVKDYGIQGPTSEPVVTVEGSEIHYVNWEVTLPTDLPINEEFKMKVTYATERGAASHELWTRDNYSYSVRRLPIADLIVEVRPKPDASFVLLNAKVIHAHDSMDVPDTTPQAGRITVTPKDRGYVYHVKYPMLGTRFQFWWEIGKRPQDVR